MNVCEERLGHRGRVQKIGYRDIVAEIANKMDITGIVENLPDGKSVKKIAEVEEDVDS